jgi:hypothetical protein
MTVSTTSRETPRGARVSALRGVGSASGCAPRFATK